MAKHPTNDELAKCLGLSAWQTGGHDARGDRPEVYIVHLWRIHAAPSFDHGWILAGAWCENAWCENSGDTPAPPGSLRVALAREAVTVTAELPEDPVAGAIRRVCLLPPPPTRVYTDGIRYWVEVDSHPASGHVAFSNPSDPTLVALEAAALKLAATVAPADGLLRQVVDRWRACAER